MITLQSSMLHLEMSASVEVSLSIGTRTFPTPMLNSLLSNDSRNMLMRNMFTAGTSDCFFYLKLMYFAVPVSIEGVMFCIGLSSNTITLNTPKN